MRRWIIRICVFLLLGAIVNVAVAWGCAWTIPFSAGKKMPPDTQRSSRKLPFDQTESLAPTHWSVSRNQRFGSDRYVIAAIARPATTTHSFEELLPPIPGFVEELAKREATPMSNAQTPGFFVCDARGWPMRSVRCEWPWCKWTEWPQPPLRGGIAFGQVTQPRIWPLGVFEIRALPYSPLWPGFAINTVFYAVILWLLFAAPFALRRRRRIKRGKCARCGYPWGTGAVCSECGSAIVGRTAAVHGAPPIPPPATPGPPSDDREHDA